MKTELACVQKEKARLEKMERACVQREKVRLENGAELTEKFVKRRIGGERGLQTGIIGRKYK